MEERVGLSSLPPQSPPILYTTHPFPPSIPSPHPSSHQLPAGSYSPHPGSEAWGCSTGPDYRCYGSRPPDGSQGHNGNPPGLHLELGGPHPSGTPSHFPGSDKTWSRFGLWRDQKTERQVGKSQLWVQAHEHPTVQKIRCKKDWPLYLPVVLPQSWKHTCILTRKRIKALPCRIPRWSYKHIKCNLLSGQFSGFGMCGCM